MATSKKKKASIIGTLITALGGIITGITVPLVQKIDKDQDEVSILLDRAVAMNDKIHTLTAETHAKIHELNDKQEENTKHMIEGVNQALTKLASDVRTFMTTLYQKDHDLELSIRDIENKIKVIEIRLEHIIANS